MKKLLILLCFPVYVFGGGLSLSWIAATQNTDGTAIPATGSLALASTKIEYVPCASVAAAVWPATPPSVLIAMPALATSLTGLTDGARYCTRASSINVAGTTSPQTLTGTGVASVTTPNPPSNLQVATLIAYYAVQQHNKYVLIPAGEVEGDTACDSTQSINGKYVVPVESVSKWYGNVRPAVLVADCVPT